MCASVVTKQGNTSGEPATIPSVSTPLRRGHSKDTTASPSSTTISESGVSTSLRPATDEFPAHVHASAGFLASRKITIRSDPALLTCFDAVDKQLYDLWAPKV